MSKLKTAFGVIHTIKSWPLYFLDYLKLAGKRRITYELRNGVSYAARTGTLDLGIVNEIWVHQHYVPKGFEIREGDVVVDMGAHIGIFSVFASRLAGKGRVYSFEPTPENFELLEHNIKLNRADNILAFNLAMADKTGQREISICASNSGGHSFYSDTGNKIIVNTISLKEFVDQNGIFKINFMKLDCEGAEYDILLACPNEVLAKVEKISMEYHNLDELRNVSVIKEFLEKKGFEVCVESEKSCMLYARRT